MSDKFYSLTMNVVIDNQSITVSYNKEFMLPFMLFMPSLLGMLLSLYTFPIILELVLIFFFIALLLGLVAHLQTFIKGDDVFLWKVNQDGFYFRANRTNFFSLKPPIFYAWSNVIKALYVKRYITLDSELDKVTIKKAVLLFLSGKKYPTKLVFPHSRKIGYEIFKVINALAPKDTVFKLLEEYDDS